MAALVRKPKGQKYQGAAIKIGFVAALLLVWHFVTTAGLVSPLFLPTTSEEGRTAARERVGSRLDYLEGLFSDGRKFLLGDAFSIADAYLFTVANWAHPTSISLEKWPRLRAFLERVAARPAVRAAMVAEGLASA